MSAAGSTSEKQTPLHVINAVPQSLCFRSAHRIGLVVEPMTCPPGAFNSGVDLDVVEPGEALTVSWQIFGIVEG